MKHENLPFSYNFMLTQCGIMKCEKITLRVWHLQTRDLSLIPASKHQKKLSTEHSLTARRLNGRARTQFMVNAKSTSAVLRKV
jgi:hypothetical protein